MRVNNATVTGESLPVSRDARPSDEPDPMHSRNALLAGTSVSGEAKALVFATGLHSAFGKIAQLTQATADASPLQIEIAALSRIVAGLALALGVIFFFIGRCIGLSISGSLIFAIGIIVANVPEGLLPTVTLALAMGSHAWRKRNALIRHLPARRSARLHHGHLHRQDRHAHAEPHGDAVGLHAGRMFDRINVPRRRHSRPRIAGFLKCAACCHDLKDARAAAGPGWLGDPMEVALVQLAADALPARAAQPARERDPVRFRAQAALDGACGAGGHGALLQRRAGSRAPACSAGAT